ncbi:MAG: hypothetical protein JWP82_3167 [Humibacillus sp.]|nr:hypothetical protein [Humibacillus sp.]
MSAVSTFVRATHLVTNAAWFGGTLAGAVSASATEPAATAASDASGGRERALLADRARGQWGPVQGVAIGLHLLSGVAILLDNRHRVVAHRPTTAAVIAKTVLTAAAVVVSAETYRSEAELREAVEHSDVDARSRQKARTLAQRMDLLQWATPAATAGLLVLDAYLGEQQRGAAGLLDTPLRLGRRRR